MWHNGWMFQRLAAKGRGAPIDAAVYTFVQTHYVEILSVAPSILLLFGVTQVRSESSIWER